MTRRLIILCEGETEEAVLSQFLEPFRGDFVIHARSTGGNNKLIAIYADVAELELREDENTVVFCLIDLYEAPMHFPPYIDADANPIQARYTYFKQQLEA